MKGKIARTYLLDRKKLPASDEQLGYCCWKASVSHAVERGQGQRNVDWYEINGLTSSRSELEHTLGERRSEKLRSACP